jgi:glycosyltransferase involved in cell wall biosynthesis
MGVPVVTMNYGGMAELVKDGVTGSLADEPTPECLADTIKKTLCDNAYYSKLRENCRREREEILGIEEYCELLIKKYKELKK